MLPTEERTLLESAAPARLLCCDSCGLSFRFPTTTEESLQHMYAAMPTDRWHYETDNVSWTLAKRWLRKQYATSDPIRILDIGAFHGAFLKSLPATWERQAVEPSAAARLELRQAGIHCLAEFLSAPCEMNTGTFEVVTMFDVFEHLPRPLESLSHAVQYLKPGGYLLVSTGNCDHWTWRLLAGEHWYCSTSQHLCFGSPRFFRRQIDVCDARLRSLRKHSHQRPRFSHAVRETFETLAYSALRDRRWWLPFIKLALNCPGLGYARHKTFAPYTPHLRDHLFVVVQRSEGPEH